MKCKVISFLLCICFIFMSFNFVYASEVNNSGVNVNRYVNTYYSENSNVSMSVSGSTLTVNLLSNDGDNFEAYVLLNDSREITMEKDEYGYFSSIDLTTSFIGDSCKVVVCKRIDSPDRAYFCFPVSVIKSGDSYIFNEGIFGDVNYSIREMLSTDSTCDMMPVDDSVSALTSEICKGLKSDVDKVYAIYDWICNNIAYNTDSAESLTSLTTTYALPSEIIEHKHAVCAGLSNLFKAMCNSVGIRCRIVAGVVGSTDLDKFTANHVWNEVYLSGGGNGVDWYFVDCTYGSKWELKNGERVLRFTDWEFNEDIFTENVTSATSFMSDRKFVNSYVRYLGHGSYGMLNLDAANYSEWASGEIKQAIYDSLLIPEFFLSDYSTSATRGYFMQLLTRYTWLTYRDILMDAPYNYSAADAMQTADAYLQWVVDEYNKSNLSEGTFSNIHEAFCVAAGIVYGKGDAGLCSNDTLTRAEAATMLYRLYSFLVAQEFECQDDLNKFILKSFDSIPVSDYFNDHSNIPDWSLNGCYGCKDKGIIKGDDKGNFLPNDKLSCEQAIAIFNRLYAKN